MADLNHFLNHYSWPLSLSKSLKTLKQYTVDFEVLSWSCPIITVAGTNGKGSVSSMLESIYLAQGYKVGLFTSPHLLKVNERIRYCGEDILDAELLYFAAQAYQEGLSFFAWMFFIALLFFKSQSELDLIILEVGIGGRCDCVNILDSEVAVVTSLGLDHVDMLGPTLSDIAREKAGVCRSGCPIVCGAADFPESFFEVVASHHSIPYVSGTDFSYNKMGDQWCWHSDTTTLDSLPYPTLRLDNAATALMVVDLLQPRLSVSVKAISAGLEHTYLPGRQELLTLGGINIYLDVAHNADSAWALFHHIKRQNANQAIYSVFSCLNVKDIASIIEPFLGLVAHWYIASLEHINTASLDEILPLLSVPESVFSCDTVEDAFTAALSKAEVKKDACIMVYGSFHTVAVIKRYLAKHFKEEIGYERTI